MGERSYKVRPDEVTTRGGGGHGCFLSISSRKETSFIGGAVMVGVP